MFYFSPLGGSFTQGHKKNPGQGQDQLFVRTEGLHSMHQWPVIEAPFWENLSEHTIKTRYEKPRQGRISEILAFE